jgi:malonate transporter
VTQAGHQYVTRLSVLYPTAELATGALASSYVNADNLGVAIAAYVLGDASYVAPVLLFQVLVLAPVGLTVLAGSRAESRSRLLSTVLSVPVLAATAVLLGG